MGTLNFSTILKGKNLKNEDGSSTLILDKNSTNSFIEIQPVPSMNLVDQINRQVKETERKLKFLKAKQWKSAIRKRR